MEKPEIKIPNDLKEETAWIKFLCGDIAEENFTIAVKTISVESLEFLRDLKDLTEEKRTKIKEILKKRDRNKEFKS